MPGQIKGFSMYDIKTIRKQRANAKTYRLGLVEIALIGWAVFEMYAAFFI